MSNFDIRHGDVLQELRKLDACSFDGCLTDPPYGLSSNEKRSPQRKSGVEQNKRGFMGLEWDGSVPTVEVWVEVLRVLKPGAMLLAFGGTRTHHRLMCAIEDAGFEIRDCAMWLYGSGFPKSLDISKAIDKAAGAEREVVGSTKHPDGKERSLVTRDSGVHDGGHRLNGIGLPVTAPFTDAARLFDGYGTALKPAYEPIVVAMKPCDGTFAQNALTHGVAGINVDAGRVDGGDGYRDTARENEHKFAGGNSYMSAGSAAQKPGFTPNSTGRWPANVILDEESGVLLDRQAGTLTSGANPIQYGSDKFQNTYQPYAGQNCTPLRGADSGGASRFFYCAKASPDERHGNNHPTVKPVDLARYLAKLILPPERSNPRRLLVPYSGSGSEMLGALIAGWEDIVGIEGEADYIAIAHARLVRHCPLFAESLEQAS